MAIILGYNSIGGTGKNNASYTFASLFSCSVAGTIPSLWVYKEFGNTCKITGAIWDASRNLVATTNEVTIVNANLEWLELPFASPVSVSVANYILGCNHDAAGALNRFYDAGAANTGCRHSVAYAGFPTDPITALDLTDKWSIYAEVTPASSGKAKLLMGVY